MYKWKTIKKDKKLDYRKHFLSHLK
jgi:hypothetical protein